MDKQLQEKILAKDKWSRGIIMALLIIVGYIITHLICIIALFQFISNLVTDSSNTKLLDLTKRINTYLVQIANYVTFNIDTKPFPFGDFPEG